MASGLSELQDAQWTTVSRRGRQQNPRRQRYRTSDRDDDIFPASEESQAKARRANEVALHIHKYVHQGPTSSSSWTRMPNVPNSKEVGSIIDGRTADLVIDLEPNRPRGAWTEGKDFYLESQYQLFREDGISPLRQAVADLRGDAFLLEKDSEVNARIYDSVFIVGMTLCRRGLMVKIEFSTKRAQKQILWPQSKRLKSGTIVALSPVKDNFHTICKVAVVTSRINTELLVEPPSKPTIHIEFGDPSEIEFDPQLEWIMVEASNGYWEAYRHTLQAAQKLQGERFPFAEHLVDVQKEVNPPLYREEQPAMNLSPATISENQHQSMNVLDDWPDLSGNDKEGNPISELDASQLEALRRILTKKLAIIQGPPGTGKTHISVVALRTLLANMTMNDPPIIISAHTNHALDQLLRHISAYEPNFVRLGGQTQDKELIGPRTLQKVKEDAGNPPSSTTRQAIHLEKQISKELQELLMPLKMDVPFSGQHLKNLDLINQSQLESLESLEQDWVGESFNESNDKMSMYCGDHLDRFRKASEASYFGIEVEDYGEDMRPEEEDLEFDYMEDKHEFLHGTFFSFKPGFVARLHATHSDRAAAATLAAHQDLANVPQQDRGSVYGYLQKMAKAKIMERLRGIAVASKNLANDFKIGRWESDAALLETARIIGMTTTGLSKYRALVTSLLPKIVLIEEAAETLEIYTTVACLPSLDQLILVGDHQQLRGHCNVSEFERAPWNLDVSLFERMVRNGIEYTQLKMQRRMRPIIREMIQPIYPQLVDHPSVNNRADIPGMGGVNSLFFTHKFPESNDDALSKQNVDEALLIICFYVYLLQNGLSPGEVTVLTFYNGQRRLILKNMAKHKDLQNMRCKVVTVDSYQGEENEVVLLSLTRNNDRGQIGFLNVDNRVCVALSRARRGLYIFGEAVSLYNKSDLWKKLLDVMGTDHVTIMEMLPLVCKNHGTKTAILEPGDFEAINGGCKEPCQKGKLPCGHDCKLKCHPQSHQDMVCTQRCLCLLECGHHCSNPCWYQEHECDICSPPVDPSVPRGLKVVRAPTADIRAGATGASTLSLRSGNTPSNTGDMSNAHVDADPDLTIYPIGTSGLPETPQGRGFRAFAAGGVHVADARLRDKTQRSNDQELSRAAESAMENIHISGPETVAVPAQQRIAAPAKGSGDPPLIDFDSSPETDKVGLKMEEDGGARERKKWVSKWTSNAVDKQVETLKSQGSGSLLD